MKFDALKPGMQVWSVEKHKMGNTTLRTHSVYSVTIVAVDAARRSVTMSWNGNPARTIYSGWEKWRLNEPVMIGTFMGGRRPATRAEIKAMKEKTP